MKVESLTHPHPLFPHMEVHSYFFPLYSLYLHGSFVIPVRKQQLWSFKGKFECTVKELQGSMSYREIYLKA